MLKHGSTGPIVGLAAGLLACCAAPAAAQLPGQPARMTAQQGSPIEDPFRSEVMRADARLHAVWAASTECVWAVGDRGAIWHTSDGGRQWRLQESGVGCTLRSVCFVDEERGWAAGGDYRPFLHTGSAVLLKTTDGGRTWSRIPGLETLSVIRKIRFADAKRGWVLCDRSAMYPSGLLTTEDGGRTFAPLPSDGAKNWRSGDLLDPLNGALGGSAGATAVIRNGTVQPSRSPRFGLRGIRQIRLVPPVYGWMIGDGGLVMMTGDGGASWQSPPGEPPPEVARQIDFAAMAVVGPNCWIAGSPGSHVLHSPDAGRTWTLQPTGQPLPIYGLSFADESHGSAVGSLGTVLVTDDGGKSWSAARAGGRRAAVLGFFCRGSDVPWEMLGRLSANEGYLSVLEIVGRDDVVAPPADRGPADARVHQAAVALGGSDTRTAWRFPLQNEALKLDSSRIAELWDQANDGRGLAECRAELVREIRIWRPEVVILPQADPTGDAHGRLLLNRLVLEALHQAGDPTAFVDQITHAGLQPWRVTRGLAVCAPGRTGSVELHTARLAERLGRSLADLAAEPRGLVQRQFEAPPAALGFRVCFGDDDPADVDDFFDGISLAFGGGARRMPLEPPAGGIDLLQRMARKARNTRAILEQTEDDPQAGAQLAAQTADLTEGLDPQSAAQILYHLANRYIASGQRGLAAQTYALLTERYPESSFSPPAAAWLVKHFGSAEEAWRVQGQQRYAVSQASTLSIDADRQQNRLEQAAGYGKQLRSTRPLLHARPELGFPLAAVDRRRGYPRDAKRFYLAESHRTGSAWQACAEAEQWLNDPEGMPPKPAVRCVQARSKPRLDGTFDDDAWQTSKPAELADRRGGTTAGAAEVRLAYDAEFLYLAIRCRQAPGLDYAPSDGPRPRDADLSKHDRVEVYLDIDRDYATWYRLSVDHRGFTAEGCWGDTTWNPSWFVAAATVDGHWQIEAAVPLDQLTGQYPQSRSAWGLGVQRIAPGVGFQSWTEPAAVEVLPEGFGLLLFE
jgi:photosystem II stability/assembly factor-like uncharacterized protein